MTQKIGNPLKLLFPSENGKVEINHNGSVVIVGANGSGKSSLGRWIEANTDPDILVHCISAQRVLNLPDHVEVKSLEQSHNALLFGHEDPRYANRNHKIAHRNENYRQNDFGKVLSTLVARDTERNEKSYDASIANNAFAGPIESPADILVKLWNEILPHRKISLKGGKVRVKNILLNPSSQESELQNCPSTTDRTEDLQQIQEYHGKEMSDGERVALYLMGQCLCAPSGSIFIIDEPELHLHSSIMKAMWDRLEVVKQDCLFVYITHDLNFASSRINATKIWIKEFDGKDKWVWELIPKNDDIPEDLLLELLGNRRSVIFCEGKKSGGDHNLYQSVYTDFHVVPVGGCEEVKTSVRSLKNNNSFSHIKAFGLIDRDYRTDEEIQGLVKSNIHCIEAATIENIFINEATLRAVATELERVPDEIIQQVNSKIRDSLKLDVEFQASLRTCRKIENRLHQLKKAVGLEEIKESINNAVAAINVESLFEENSKLYTDLLNNGSLNEILKYYKNEGLVKIVGKDILGLEDYDKFIFRMLNSDKRHSILEGIKTHLPEIQLQQRHE